MDIVTRFAPSPTGVLHTGSARTALYNWLFSRHNKGKFLLRIEDTDKERSRQEYTESILRDLKWLGIDWDGEIVYQAKNLNRHQQVVAELVDRGSAYRCYCTEEEIEAFKVLNPHQKFLSPWRDNNTISQIKECKERGAMPIEIGERRSDDAIFKNGNWYKLGSEDVGKPYVVRLKAPRDGKTLINDLIQGEIVVANQELDDMVLLRSDGTPTYMLAVVVDDHDMGVTHVIRGDDHLTNAFRQKQIYLGMGWDVPEFAHIPLIHDKEGKKLSKRTGAMGIDTYKDLGYLPEGVINHLLRLGWGHGNDEIIDKEKAIEWFTLDGVGKSPARFDQDKLDHINAHYMRQKSDHELFTMIQPMLGISSDSVYSDRIIKGMPGLKQRAVTLVELAEASNIYISKRENIDQKSQEIMASGAKDLLMEFKSLLSDFISWDKESLHTLGNDFAIQKAVKPAFIMQALRAGVLGTFSAPGIYEVMEVLGKDETLKRLEKL